MASAVLSGIESWTGDRPETCPWRALSDPLVQWVVSAYSAFKRGVFASYAPEPTHRQMEGVIYYDRALDAVEYHQFKEEQANQARDAR